MDENKNDLPISPISEDTIAAMRRASAMTLPDDPSAARMKAGEIRRRFWVSIFGERGSLLAELARVIEEVNDYLRDLPTGGSGPGGGSVEDVMRLLEEHDESDAAHGDIRRLINAIKVPTKLSAFENDQGFLTGYTETDPTVPAWAKEKTKPSYSKSEVGLENVDNVKQYSASNPPPYPVTSVNSKTGAVSLGAGDVGADKSGTASSAVSSHNTNASAHNDIRLLIEGLSTRLNAIANSDDTTLDDFKEAVAYIKANRALIEAITTSKVSVTDIVDNLATNVSNKPLSAAQGVALKVLIDAIKVPTKLSDMTEDAGHRTVTDTEKTAWNAKLGQGDLQAATDAALEQAKVSGEFDGADGQRGTGTLKVSTTPTSYTTTTNGISPIKRMSISTIKSEAGVSEVLVGDCICHSYYLYHIYYVDATYAYMDKSQSIRGAAGKTPAKGTDYWTDADKAEMIADVLANFTDVSEVAL